MSIIDPATDETLPRIPEGKSAMCISCGQCEAFCPTGALVQGPTPGNTPGEKASAPGEISPGHLGTYLKSRRSIRQYRPDPVKQETIEAILDIARYAASGGNGQPVEWLVIHDPAGVKKIADLTVEWMRELAKSNHPMSSYAPHLIAAYGSGNDVICRGAPHLLIPHIPKGNPIAPTDAIIALTQVDITAPAFGVGTCWAGFVAGASQNYAPLLDFYSLPEGRIPAYAMMFGYPKLTPHYIPSRKPARIIWK
jgi:nitroreductase